MRRKLFYLLSLSVAIGARNGGISGRSTLTRTKWLGAAADSTGAPIDWLLEFTHSIGSFNGKTPGKYAIAGDTIVLFSPLGPTRLVVSGDSRIWHDGRIIFHRAK